MKELHISETALISGAAISLATGAKVVGTIGAGVGTIRGGLLGGYLGLIPLIGAPPLCRSLLSL